MADPINTLPTEGYEKLSDALNKLSNETIQNFNKHMMSADKNASDFGKSLTGISGNIGEVIKNFANLGNSVGDFGRSGNSAAAKVGLLNTALFGTREISKDLNTQNFSGFSKAFDSVSSNLKESGGLAAKMQSTLQGAFAKLGGIGALPAEFLKNLMKGADNAIIMENRIVSLAAQQGSLGKLWNLVGNNLENLTDHMSAHTALIVETARATGTMPSKIEEYHASLGRLPNALTETAHGMSLFSAAILNAAGTGRDFAEVQKDLTEAYDQYGLSGEKALKFTNEMTLATQNTGVQFDKIHEALTQEAKTLGRFADAGDKASTMSSSLAKNMSEYVQRFKDVGMAGPAAIEAVKGVTGQIGNMGIAQKAFLSGQTGGPGGLMGAFQIDKLLKEGKISEVMDKVQQQMKKQLGSVVTLDDATKSQGAAAQMARQVAMLKQGPLGAMVKDDQTAYRMLEMMKKKEAGAKFDMSAFGEKGEDKTKESIDRGFKIKAGQRTIMNKFAEDQYIRQTSGEASNVKLARDLFSAESGSVQGSMESESRRKSHQEMQLAQYKSARASENIKGDLGGDKNFAKLKQGNVLALQAYKSTKDAIGMISGGNESLKEAQEAQREVEKRTQLLSLAKGEEAKKKANENLDQARKDATKKENKYKETYGFSLEEHAAKSEVDENGNMPGLASQKIAATIPKASKKVESGKEEATAAGAKGKTAEAGPKDIHVHVTGYCLKCKNDIEGSSQARSVNSAMPK